VRADGVTYGDTAILDSLFRKRQALKSEYDHWATVLAGVWQVDSPIATLRTIVLALQRPRPDVLGESLRRAIKKSAEMFLVLSERDLSEAPRLLNYLVENIEQQRNLLSEQYLQANN
jgi:hypothetical protein